MTLSIKIYNSSIDATKLKVTYLEGVEDLSKPFFFDLEVLSATLLEDSVFIQKIFTLELEWGQSRRLQGFIDSCTMLPKKADNGELLFSYRLRFCSMLFHLMGDIKTVAYINENIETIFRKILQNSFKMNIQVQIQLSEENNQKEAVIVQYEENDFEFIQRIIKKHQLNYISTFSKKDGVESILITDNLSTSNSSFVSFQTKKEKATFASGSHCIDQIFFLSKDFDPLTNYLSYSGQGQFIVNGIADGLSLCQHPISSFNQKYSIISLKTVIKNDSQFTSPSFLVEFTLLDSKTEFPQHHSMPNNLINTLLTAQIISDYEDKADLDDVGWYSVYLQYSDKPLKADQSSFRAPLLKDYQAGDNQGGSNLSFSGPLLKNTTVLMQWVYSKNTLWPRPIITGVLPDKDLIENLTNQDPSQMLISHQDGAQFSLNKNKVNLSCNSLTEENNQESQAQSGVDLEQYKLSIESPSVTYRAKNISYEGKLKKASNGDVKKKAKLFVKANAGLELIATAAISQTIAAYNPGGATIARLPGPFKMDEDFNPKKSKPIELVEAGSFTVIGPAAVNAYSIPFVLDLVITPISFLITGTRKKIATNIVQTVDTVMDVSGSVTHITGSAMLLGSRIFHTGNYSSQRVVENNTNAHLQNWQGNTVVFVFAHTTIQDIVLQQV